MKKLLSILACFLFLSSACDNDELGLSEMNYVTFGIYAGECLGDCFAVYRVTSLRLEEDISVQYFSNNYEFIGNRRLDNAALNQARSLLVGIPLDLLASDKDRYGCPDCADQGGYYLSFSHLGNERTVLLDTRDTDDQSLAIIAYKKRLREVLNQLSD